MATRQAGSRAPNACSDAAVTWQGLNPAFTGVVFDGGDFSTGRFSSEIVLFTGAVGQATGSRSLCGTAVTSTPVPPISEVISRLAVVHPRSPEMDIQED